MASPSPTPSSMSDDELRAKAIKRIERKREFRDQVIFFLIVNAGLWVGWALTGANTNNPWPAWITGVWLLILVIDAFKVYGDRPVTDQQIIEELRRMQGR